MENSSYCPAIHSGIFIGLNKTEFVARPCCQFQVDGFDISKFNNHNYFDSDIIKNLIQANDNNQRLAECSGCYNIEQHNGYSYRQSLIDRFGDHNTGNLLLLDLMYDNSCNLACRTCNESFSTLWSKHLKDNNLPTFQLRPINDINLSHKEYTQKILDFISNLNVKSISQIKISGGEPLMHNGYFNLLENLTNGGMDFSDTELLIQTNGTIPLRDTHYKIFEKFRLVKLSFSIDGIEDRFEYLRWPGKWHKLTSNLNDIKNSAPSNVMFNIEETISIFNLYYHHEVANWMKDNFNANREGDLTSHNIHLAGGIFSLTNLTNLYASGTNYQYTDKSFKENPDSILKMIDHINKFDVIRNQDWLSVFPKLKDFYRQYI
jgi:organic radical activating enzyme